MTILLCLLAVLLVVAGLAGTVFPVIPGVPLLFAGLWLAAWIEDYAKVGGWTVVVLGALAALAVIVDAVASLLGAKRVGASRQAIAGAAVGMLVGVFFGLPGVLIGPFAGAVVGEALARGNLEQATRAGIGTWLGLLFGTVVKLAVSLAMLGIFAFAYFF